MFNETKTKITNQFSNAEKSFGAAEFGLLEAPPNF